MNETDKRRLWNLALTALGITTIGLWLGLKRFLWRLWIALSGLWIGFWVLFEAFVDKKNWADPYFWSFVFAPPILLLFVAGVLSWIIDGLRGDVSDQSSVRTIDDSNPEKEHRRALGYDE